MATNKTSKKDAAMAVGFALAGQDIVAQQMEAYSPVRRELREAKESELLPVSAIFPSPYQVLTTLDEAHVEELMASITASSLYYPIIVRPLQKCQSSDTLPNEQECQRSDTFELVAGHHRLEAFRRLGRDTVPALVCA